MAVPRCSLLLCLLALSCGEEPSARPCQSDADCTLPDLCGEDGLCSAPTPGKDGAPCSHPDHCESGLCVDATGQGGSCVTICAAPADCAAGEICAPLLGQSLPLPSGGKPAPQARLLCQAPGKGGTFLGESCTADADCTSGLCETDRCTQPCETACPGAMVCEQATLVVGAASLKSGLCRRRLLRTVEVGAADVPQGGMTAPLTFDIEAGVDSFLLFADDAENTRVALTRLDAPDGTSFVSYADPANAQMYAFDYPGTGTVQVPGTDSAKGAVQPGTYKLWVQTHDPLASTLVPVVGKVERVAVLTRNSKQKGGLLDLDLHFSPGSGLSAAAAPTDPLVAGALAELRALYHRMLGVGLGQVRYLDLPATWDSIPDWTAVDKLRTAHSQAGPNGLSINVFFVKDIGLSYLGLAGGIPGVPGLAGRPLSGIVVEKQSTAKKTGRLLAHEIGHILGLRHTTEQGAQIFDKIGDTPQCPSGTQVDQCPDYQDLMFPFYMNAPDPLTLSRGQAAVVRASPWLYEEAYPEACGPGTEVVDVSASGFAGGTTSGAAATLQSSCGGAGQGERVHLYRLGESGLTSLDIEAHGTDFAPVVSVLSGSCDGKGTELACQSGKQGDAVKLSVSAPQPGAYFVVVDSDSGAGDYWLTVTPVK